MNLNRLVLSHFRNYEDLDVLFSPGMNVICGENAQGKTNLLEAAAYLSRARSHRARGDKELISFDSDFSVIRGDVFARNREFIVEARLFRAGQKRLLVNGVRQKTAAGLSGALRTVLFCPEDLNLILEGPAVRRKFLDGSLCQLRPRYSEALVRYNRSLEQKTRILRDFGEKPSLLETLDAFNRELAKAGAVLMFYRARYVKKLSKAASAIHFDCSGGREELHLAYETVKTVKDQMEPPEQLFSHMMERLDALGPAELSARSCLVGPHRDDISAEINGKSARSFGSQGQVRTAALSLKLAERDIHYEDMGEHPVLLLDDVLSELDSRRQEFVLNRIAGGQVFLTCCETEPLRALREGASFRVQNGRVTAAREP
ncbi:MAG: DNA replication/repair protein RecF [Oscillospiraceae bacterium]|nr:DNA replication/repair protein RecF [Oscillospiraceae bacterium]